MITRHRNGNARTRAGIEYRLEDANWHSVNRALQEGRYGDEQRLNDEDYPTRASRGGYRRRETYSNASTGLSVG